MKRQLAQYRLEEEIGAGGMGVVYRARDENLNRDVAIKVLPAGALSDDDTRKRFRAEALALSRVNHPNIATIHDFNSDDGVDFLVMEYIRGEGLETRLRRAPLPETEIVAFGTQLAEGLMAAHEQHLVHRDLKPANLRVTKDGRLKILDFGLAKLIASDDETLAKARTAGISGTLPYMAPEQVEGADVDARTDIHAAGAVLYEMATARRPFHASRTSDLIAAICNAVPPEPHTVNAAISPQLSEIVMRCLEKDPAHRYQSAAELLAALRRHGAKSPATEPVRRPRARVTTSVVAGAVIVLAVAAAVMWQVKRPAPPPEAPPAIRSLAILPFRIIGAGGQVAGMGITDTVVTKISKLGGVVVRPTSAVRKFNVRDVDVLSAGRELQVDAVLDGNLRQSGNQTRVSMNLVRVADGSSIWTEQLDLPARDVFAIEDQVATEVANALRLRVGSQTAKEALTKRYTNSAVAQESYARAKELFDRRIGDPEALHESRIWFQRAIDADPSYALAHANLGYANLWVGLFSEADDPRWLALARTELDRAQSLDPSIPDTHIARSDLLWSASEGFDMEGALRELAAAQRLDASRGHSELATLLYHLGLEKPAMAALRRALEIDPTDAVNRYHYIEGLSILGHHAQALAAAERFGRSAPVSSLLAMNRLDEAEKVIAKTRTQRSTAAAMIANSALLAALRKDDARARALLDEAFANVVRGNRTYHHITYVAAAVHALAGDSSGAVRWLQETVEFGMPNSPLFASDSHLDAIRHSPEFVAFMKDLRPRWDRLVRVAEAQ